MSVSNEVAIEAYVKVVFGCRDDVVVVAMVDFGSNISVIVSLYEFH